MDFEDIRTPAGKTGWKETARLFAPLVAGIAVLGVLMGIWDGYAAQERWKQTRLSMVGDRRDALNVERVAALAASPRDSTLARRLGEQLDRLGSTVPGFHSFHILAPDSSGRWHPIAGSDHHASHESCPCLPSLVGAERAPEPAVVALPGTDSTSPMAASLELVRDPRGGTIVGALLSCQVDSPWERRYANALPSLFASLALLLILGAGVVAYSRDLPRRGSAGMLRTLRLPLLLFGSGAVATAWIAWNVDGHEQGDRRSQFEVLAKHETEHVLERIRAIRETELESLVRFFAGSDQVTQQEFAQFSTYLSRNRSVASWQWAAWIDSAHRAAFERAHRDLLGSSGVWERDPTGRKASAARRPWHAALLNASPSRDFEAFLGTDLASDSVLLGAFREAMATGLPSCTAPFARPGDPSGDRWIALVHPVKADSATWRGFAIAMLYAPSLLRNAEKHPMVALTLGLLGSRGVELLASTAQDADSGGMARRRAFFGFGRVFDVLAVPSPLFLERHARVSMFYVLAGGLLLSLVIASLAFMIVRRRENLERILEEHASELRKREESYKAQFADNSAPMLLIDPRDRRIVEANSAAVRFYGWPRELLLSMRSTDLNVDDDATLVSLPRSNALLEFRHRLADGRIRDVEISASFIEMGVRTVLHAIVHDVTERKRAERERHELEQRLEWALDAAGDGIWDWNILAGKVSHNRRWCEILGLDESFLEHPLDVFSAHIHPDDREAVFARVQACLEGRGNYECVYRMLHNDGRSLWVLDRGDVMERDASGSPTRMVGSIADITERKQAEDALREEEARRRLAMDLARIVHWEYDFETKTFTFNEQYYALHRTSYAKEGKWTMGVDEWLRRFAPESAIPVILENVNRAKSSDLPGVTCQFEHEARMEDGEIRVMSVRLGLDKDSSGRTVHIFGATQDVTEQKRAEAALRAVEAQRSLAMDLARIASWEYDPVSGTVLLNDGFLALFGTDIEREGAYELPIEEYMIRFIAPEDAPMVAEAVRCSLESDESERSGDSLEHRCVRHDGSTMHLAVQWTAIRSANSRVARVIGVCQDVTERRLAEQALRASEAQRALAMDLAHIAAWELDLHTGEFTFDDQFLALYGTSVEQEGRTRMSAAGFVARFVDPEDRPKVVEVFGTLVGGRDADDGAMEAKSRKADGSELYVAVRWIVERNAEGVPYRALGATQDITERKRSELELESMNRFLEDATAKANSLAAQAEMASIAKSEFLANMSHEIRTPLNGIIGMTGLLMDTPLDERQRHHAEVVRQSGESLLALLNDILDLSKIEAGRLEMETIEFDLGQVLEDFAAVLALKASEKGVELLCGAAPSVPFALRGDPGRLRQILINLAGNAVKFTSEGEVAVTVQVVTESDTHALLRFSVRDTGIGVPSDKIGSLFQKFVQVDSSTARKYGGTGLGLAISRQLAEMMDGEIGVDSVQGQGSEFWFTARLEKQRGAPAQPSLPARLAGTRVLVAESNATGRRLLLERLSAWGLETDSASSGEEALDALREASASGRPYAAALLALRMGGMDGLETSQAIRAIPEVRATRLALMPPISHGADRSMLRESGIDTLVPKPIRASALRHAILELLDPEASRTDADSTRSEDRAAPPATFSPSSRLLLAEDNSVNQMVALGILESMGLRADVAGNGIEALEMLRTIPYDLVLMDVQMPDMDGFEATRRIRSGESGVPSPRIPVVAMTANAMRGDRERCLEAGMDAYVAKPIDPRDLARVLAHWLPAGGEGAPRPGEAAAPASEPAVFDRAALMERVLGNATLFERIVGHFLQMVPPEIDELAAVVASGDLPDAARHAHRIRGAAGNVGALALAESVGRLEAFCLQDELDLARLEMASVRSQLERWSAVTRRPTAG